MNYSDNNNNNNNIISKRYPICYKRVVGLCSHFYIIIIIKDVLFTIRIYVIQ